MKAWYFSTTEKKLGYGDNRQIRTGRTHKVKGKLRLCGNGLHASEKLIDALRHAPGCYLWEVELSGEVIKGTDQCCASERTYRRGFNAKKLLRKSAKKQALINIDKIKPYCSEEDYNLVVDYLNSDCESAAAAARSAAYAARSAADAAESATESAAESAAWMAARSAEPDAWSAAAWFEDANTMLTQMVEEEFKRRGGE